MIASAHANEARSLIEYGVEDENRGVESSIADSAEPLKGPAVQCEVPVQERTIQFGAETQNRGDVKLSGPCVVASPKSIVDTSHLHRLER